MPQIIILLRKHCRSKQLGKYFEAWKVLARMHLKIISKLFQKVLENNASSLQLSFSPKNLLELICKIGHGVGFLRHYLLTLYFLDSKL